MFAVSARNTAAGIKRRKLALVTDAGIDLRPKQPEPQPVKPVDDPRLMELRRAADEAIDCANRAIARMRSLQGWMKDLEYGVETNTYRPTVARIVKRISKATKVSVHEIHSNRRCKEIVFARQAVMYWARRLTRMSLPEIGRRIGGKDHTTVMHGSCAYPQKRAEMGRHLRSAR